jgi:hypothetical protein
LAKTGTRQQKHGRKQPLHLLHEKSPGWIVESGLGQSRTTDGANCNSCDVRG